MIRAGLNEIYVDVELDAQIKQQL